MSARTHAYTYEDVNKRIISRWKPQDYVPLFPQIHQMAIINRRIPPKSTSDAIGINMEAADAGKLPALHLSTLRIAISQHQHRSVGHSIQRRQPDQISSPGMYLPESVKRYSTESPVVQCLPSPFAVSTSVRKHARNHNHPLQLMEHRNKNLPLQLGFLGCTTGKFPDKNANSSRPLATELSVRRVHKTWAEI